MEVREELRQEILASRDGRLQYVDAHDLDPIREWKMSAGELKRIPQFYKAVHAYSDTLKGANERDAFYNEPPPPCGAEPRPMEVVSKPFGL